MNQVEKKHPDPERANTRRKQVLDAAESCFSRRGFHGASMAEISKAAGMSAGHIYNYFDSKDAIIAAFVMKNTERVSNLMQDLAQREDPLQSVIDNAGEHVLESLDPKTWVMPLEIFAEASRNPAIAEMLHCADRRSRALFLTIIRDAHQARPAGRRRDARRTLECHDRHVPGLARARGAQSRRQGRTADRRFPHRPHGAAAE